MAKAIGTISFLDEGKMQAVQITVEDNYNLTVNWLDPAELEKEPEEPKPTLGDKVEKAIDWATGGKLKKCGGCERRKALLNKLSGENNEG